MHPHSGAINFGAIKDSIKGEGRGVTVHFFHFSIRFDFILKRFKDIYIKKMNSATGHKNAFCHMSTTGSSVLVIYFLFSVK